MALNNPLLLKLQRPKTKILYAVSQLQGTRATQEDYFLTFNDECFAVADGVGGMPHGDVAARLAAETAVWGYRHVRLRPYYWNDKKLFMKRIFRSTNIAVWQKHRESGFEDGLATTLVVCLIGDKSFWIGSVGDSRAYLWRDEVIKQLTKDDVDERGFLTKVIGGGRYGLVPQFFTDTFYPHDVILLATDGVTKAISGEKLCPLLAESGTTTQSLTDAVVKILRTAQANGATDNMTALLIKRVANT